MRKTGALLLALGVIAGASILWRGWDLDFGPQTELAGTADEERSLGLIGEALAAGNAPPVADAGFDQTVTVGATVSLDGSGSTDDGGKLLSSAWTIVSAPIGSTASLSDATLVNPTFVADLAGDYTIELVATEGPRSSDPDAVVISTSNSVPVADGGRDQAVEIGTTVQLDGTASWDVDGDLLAYSWTLVSVPGGSGAALSDATDPRPTFFVDSSGDYIIELTVDDGTATSAVATVTYSTDNLPPVADAGPNVTSSVGATLEFEAGRSFDPDGDQLSYDWALVARPSGSGASLSTPSTSRPGLTLDVTGTYVLQLTVDDGNELSIPDTLMVSVDNSAPVADAGPDQTVAVSATSISTAAAPPMSTATCSTPPGR